MYTNPRGRKKGRIFFFNAQSSIAVISGRPLRLSAETTSLPVRPTRGLAFIKRPWPTARHHKINSASDECLATSNYPISPPYLGLCTICSKIVSARVALTFVGVKASRLWTLQLNIYICRSKNERKANLVCCKSRSFTLSLLRGHQHALLTNKMIVAATMDVNASPWPHLSDCGSARKPYFVPFSPMLHWFGNRKDQQLKGWFYKWHLSSL